MELYYNIVYWFPALITIVGIVLMVFNPAKRGLSIKRMIGLIFICIGGAIIIGINAITYSDTIYYNSPGGLVLKCFKLPSNDNKVPPVIHDTIYVNNIDSIMKNLPVNSGDTTRVLPDTMYISFVNKNGHMDMLITIGNNTFTGLYDTGFDGYLAVDYVTYYKLVGSGIIQENVFVDTLNYTIGDGTTCYQKVFIIPQVTLYLA